MSSPLQYVLSSDLSTCTSRVGLKREENMHTRHVEVRRWKEFRRSVGHLDDDRTTTCSESVTEENDKQSLIDLETDTKT